MRNWTEEDFLKCPIWYHATLKRYQNNILKKVIADINKDTELDFGYGFYLCPNFEWALKYAKGLAESDGSDACVIEYHFTLENLLCGSTNYRFFGELNTEFADFVFYNRMYFENYPSKCIHDYLLVGGVMSDGQQTIDFDKYRNNKIIKEELYRRLCIPKEDWQVVIHSQELCDQLPKAYAVYDIKEE